MPRPDDIAAAVVAFLRDFLDAVPHPAYVLAGDGRLLATNHHAGPRGRISPSLLEALKAAIPPAGGGERFRVTSIAELARSGLHVVLDLAQVVDRDAQALLAAKKYGLTPTETQVLVRRNRGLLREAIARELGRKEGTVRTHLLRIHSKLGVRSFVELLALVAGMRAS
ncbi:MAG: helix-turn-helix transcriptional regulator [Deltaproteobacteria bacterium]|nr:helix-turn-helix transcriptional regulator [Deltaproteobacteria bacterium]